MPDVIHVSPGMSADVFRTMENAGIKDGKFPTPVLPEQRAYQPSISPSLVEMVERETAAPADPTVTAASLKILGLDHKEVVAAVSELLKARKIPGDASKLSVHALSGLYAVAQQPERAKGRK